MRPKWNLETLLAVCSLPIIYALLSQLRLMLLQAPWSLSGQVAAVSSSWQRRHNDADCLEDDCIQRVAEALSRPWKQRALDTWCHAESSEGTSSCVLVKVPKSASSTVTGMVLRLGLAYNCSVSWQHGTAREKLSNYHQHNDLLQPPPPPPQIFLLAPIRLPHKRALSDVYFHQLSFHAAAAGNAQPADAFVKKQVDKVPANFILEYTRVDNRTLVSANTAMSDYSHIIADIMAAYDFLLLVERIDESMVVLAWILNVPVTALLTFSSKQADSWYLVGTGGGRSKCIRLMQPLLTPAIHAHFDSAEWKRRNYGDLLLHATANKSLDRTIEAIGQALVAKQVEQLQQYKKRLQDDCSNQTHFPCSDHGQPQIELARNSCIERDFGCGFKCTQELFARDTRSRPP